MTTTTQTQPTTTTLATTTWHVQSLSESFETGRRPRADLSFWSGPVEAPQHRRALRARRTVSYVPAARARRVR